jgi:hypothetical protein
MHRIIGGISSQGMKVGFISNMLGTGYGPHGGEHPRTGEQDHYLYENYADGSMESLRLPCCDHITCGWIVQCIMVHRSKLSPFGSKFLSIWVESKAKDDGLC